MVRAGRSPSVLATSTTLPVPRCLHVHASALRQQKRGHEVQLELRPQVALAHLAQGRIAHDARGTHELIDLAGRLQCPLEQRIRGARQREICGQSDHSTGMALGELFEARAVASTGQHRASLPDQALHHRRSDATGSTRDQHDLVLLAHADTTARGKMKVGFTSAGSPSTSTSSSSMKLGASTHRIVW